MNSQNVCYNPSFWNVDDNTQMLATWASLTLQYDFIKGTVLKELHYRTADDASDAFPFVEVYHTQFDPISDSIKQHRKFKTFLENNQFCKNWLKPWQLEHVLRNSFFYIEEDSGVFSLDVNSECASVLYSKSANPASEPYELFLPRQKNFVMYHNRF